MCVCVHTWTLVHIAFGNTFLATPTNEYLCHVDEHLIEWNNKWLIVLTRVTTIAYDREQVLWGQIDERKISKCRATIMRAVWWIFITIDHYFQGFRIHYIHFTEKSLINRSSLVLKTSIKLFSNLFFLDDVFFPESFLDRYRQFPQANALQWEAISTKFDGVFN